MQVKIPVTNAGVAAIEEATYRGVNINATVSFCVPQAIAVAEAIERGLHRRDAEGLDIEHMSPVCTIMVGRLDDWLHVLEKRDGIVVTPGYDRLGRGRVLKKAYQIFSNAGTAPACSSRRIAITCTGRELIGGDICPDHPVRMGQAVQRFGYRGEGAHQ